MTVWRPCLITALAHLYEYWFESPVWCNTWCLSVCRLWDVSDGDWCSYLSNSTQIALSCCSCLSSMDRSVCCEPLRSGSRAFSLVSRCVNKAVYVAKAGMHVTLLQSDTATPAGPLYVWQDFSPVKAIDHNTFCLFCPWAGNNCRAR